MITKQLQKKVIGGQYFSEWLWKNGYYWQLVDMYRMVSSFTQLCWRSKISSKQENFHYNGFRCYNNQLNKEMCMTAHSAYNHLQSGFYINSNND